MREFTASSKERKICFIKEVLEDEVGGKKENDPGMEGPLEIGFIDLPAFPVNPAGELTGVALYSVPNTTFVSVSHVGGCFFAEQVSAAKANHLLEAFAAEVAIFIRCVLCK